MFERFLHDSRLPAWMRRTHPLVARILRQKPADSLRYVVFGSSIGLFLLFGGLSLPLLYLFLWLSILMQQATTTAARMHAAQEKQTWDVLRAAPFSPRELLLSIWAGNFWHLNRSWVMNIYRLLQGTAVIGVIVYGLWFAAFPPQQAVTVLLVGLGAIVFQPVSEAYFSGMIGVLFAGYIRQSTGALGATIFTVLAYWCLCLALIIWILFTNSHELDLAHLLIALSLPSLLPLVLGYTALRAAEIRLQNA
ncbi:MAG TPA: hypothetical protein VHO69_05205 [Phototrophicaceae bacterium]|nr:hypothetical protein [Phototrophicaceae bacterium]